MKTTKIQPKVGDTFKYAGVDYIVKAINTETIELERDIAIMKRNEQGEYDGSGEYEMIPVTSTWNREAVGIVINDSERYK